MSLVHRISRQTRRAALAVAGAALLVAGSTGCSKSAPTWLDPNRGFLDPGELGRYEHEVLPIKIRDVIDPGLETPNREYAMATEPTAEDLVVGQGGDYVISENDLLAIEIQDLAGVGTQTVKQARVTESGRISLPYVGPVRASGLTEFDLEEAIKREYREKRIIESAQVSVTTIERRGSAITVLGAVNAPGQYAIVDPDLRVLEVLSLARDTLTPLVEDMYILRRTDVQRRTPGGGAAPGTTRPGGATPTGPVDLAPPPPQGRGPANPRERATFAGAEPADLSPAAAGAQPAGKGRTIVLPDGSSVFVADDAPLAPAAAPGAAPVVPAAAPAGASGGEARTAGAFAFNEPTYPDNVRVIHIPLDKLRSGALQYNIVIRPKDTIVVQNLPIGTYYMGGHVLRPGAYSLTGQKVTLKQAIISASMLDALAMPDRTDIIRRIGPNQEIFMRVDLARIFAGHEPDIYLKPDDQVMVGSSAIAPFLAAVRGAFRFTYGFGFLYDRNFAVDEDQQSF